MTDMPIVPNFDDAASEGRKMAIAMGFPVIIKAASGGGGRGR